MAIQGGYTLDHNKAFVGQIADGQLSDIVSKLNKGAANIAFGSAVVEDGVDAAKLPTTASTAPNFVGVAVRELNRAYAHTDGSDFGAVANKDFSVMTTGAIWVKVGEAVTARDPACFYITAGNFGKFGKTAAGGSQIAIPNAKFLTSATANGIALLSLVIGG